MNQCFITHEMAVVVVDELKIIQIANEEGGILFRFLRGIKVLGKVFPHIAQVMETGQFVSVGEDLELFLADCCAHPILDKFITGRIVFNLLLLSSLARLFLAPHIILAHDISCVKQKGEKGEQNLQGERRNRPRSLCHSKTFNLILYPKKSLRGMILALKLMF